MGIFDRAKEQWELRMYIRQLQSREAGVRQQAAEGLERMANEGGPIGAAVAELERAIGTLQEAVLNPATGALVHHYVQKDDDAAIGRLIRTRLHRNHEKVAEQLETAMENAVEKNAPWLTAVSGLMHMLTCSDPNFWIGAGSAPERAGTVAERALEKLAERLQKQREEREAAEMEKDAEQGAKEPEQVKTGGFCLPDSIPMNMPTRAIQMIPHLLNAELGYEFIEKRMKPHIDIEWNSRIWEGQKRKELIERVTQELVFHFAHLEDWNRIERMLKSSCNGMVEGTAKALAALAARENIERLVPALLEQVDRTQEQKKWSPWSGIPDGVTVSIVHALAEAARQGQDIRLAEQMLMEEVRDRGKLEWRPETFVGTGFSGVPISLPESYPLQQVCMQALLYSYRTWQEEKTAIVIDRERLMAIEEIRKIQSNGGDIEFFVPRLKGWMEEGDRTALPGNALERAGQIRSTYYFSKRDWKELERMVNHPLVVIGMHAISHVQLGLLESEELPEVVGLAVRALAHRDRDVVRLIGWQMRMAIGTCNTLERIGRIEQEMEAAYADWLKKQHQAAGAGEMQVRIRVQQELGGITNAIADRKSAIVRAKDGGEILAGETIERPSKGERGRMYQIASGLRMPTR